MSKIAEDGAEQCTCGTALMRTISISGGDDGGYWLWESHIVPKKDSHSTAGGWSDSACTWRQKQPQTEIYSLTLFYKDSARGDSAIGAFHGASRVPNCSRWFQGPLGAFQRLIVLSKKINSLCIYAGFDCKRKIFCIFFWKNLQNSRKSCTFASRISATLPAEQRTRAELFLFIWDIQRNRFR